MEEWEYKEEQEPDSLRRKWDREEIFEPGSKPCPHCEKLIKEDAFMCIYCGERVFNDSGFLGKMAEFSEKYFIWFVLVIISLIFFAWY